MDFSKVKEAVMTVAIAALAITGCGAKAHEIAKPALENLPTYSAQEYEVEDTFAEAVNLVMDRIEDSLDLKEKSDEAKEKVEAGESSPESSYNGDPPDLESEIGRNKVDNSGDNDDEGNDSDVEDDEGDDSDVEDDEGDDSDVDDDEGDDSDVDNDEGDDSDEDDDEGDVSDVDNDEGDDSDVDDDEGDDSDEDNDEGDVSDVDNDEGDDLGNHRDDSEKTPSENIKESSAADNSDDLGSSPDDSKEDKNSEQTKEPNDMPQDNQDDLGTDPRDSELASLWDELNKKLDEQQERTEHREQFQQSYNQDAVNGIKESDPEQYERMMAANRMATREEIDAAAGGETCWDTMSAKDKFEMLETNPDRAKALLQDYQDRHPGGMDEDEPGFDRKMMHENQMLSKAERDNNDGIPQDMLDSKDPFKEFVSAEQTESNRV